MSLLQKLRQKAKQLKSEAQILTIAYKDKRTPFSAKIIIGLTIGYLLSPIDLIPDFIPVLGVLDDLIIVPLLISLSIKLIPSIVLSDARQTIKTDPKVLKKSNWLFGTLIIVIWLLLIYFAYRRFSYLWK